MPNVKISGGFPLTGVVKVSGSKNAAIPLICASLLAKGKVLFRNVPRISDVDNLIRILQFLDCDVRFKGHTMLINNTNLKYRPLIFSECKKIRGSYYLVGIFLTIFSRCEFILPGGCQIGKRPIDIHLQAFEDMGFECTIIDDILSITKKQVLDEVMIRLKNKSVGASLNALFAGLCISKLQIGNTLFEPEGKDVMDFLNKIGYSVQLKEDVLQYQRQNLDFKFVKHSIIPDRMEAMTYVIAGLLIGFVRVQNVNTNDMLLPLSLLKDSGFDLTCSEHEIFAKKSKGKGMNISTSIYPGFPTDMQPLFGVLCAMIEDYSTIEECIFENRMHLYEDLKELGVNVTIRDSRVELYGQENIDIQVLKARDLRHGVAIVLLALASKSNTRIENFEYVDRGYEDFIKKITHLGGKISILP